MALVAFKNGIDETNLLGVFTIPISKKSASRVCRGTETQIITLSCAIIHLCPQFENVGRESSLKKNSRDTK